MSLTDKSVMNAEIKTVADLFNNKAPESDFHDELKLINRPGHVVNRYFTCAMINMERLPTSVVIQICTMDDELSIFKKYLNLMLNDVGLLECTLLSKNSGLCCCYYLTTTQPIVHCDPGVRYSLFNIAFRYAFDNDTAGFVASLTDKAKIQLNSRDSARLWSQYPKLYLDPSCPLQPAANSREWSKYIAQYLLCTKGDLHNRSLSHFVLTILYSIYDLMQTQPAGLPTGHNVYDVLNTCLIPLTRQNRNLETERKTWKVIAHRHSHVFEYYSNLDWTKVNISMIIPSTEIGDKLANAISAGHMLLIPDDSILLILQSPQWVTYLDNRESVHEIWDFIFSSAHDDGFREKLFKSLRKKLMEYWMHNKKAYIPSVNEDHYLLCKMPLLKYLKQETPGQISPEVWEALVHIVCKEGLKSVPDRYLLRFLREPRCAHLITGQHYHTWKQEIIEILEASSAEISTHDLSLALLDSLHHSTDGCHAKILDRISLHLWDIWIKSHKGDLPYMLDFMRPEVGYVLFHNRGILVQGQSKNDVHKQFCFTMEYYGTTGAERYIPYIEKDTMGPPRIKIDKTMGDKNLTGLRAVLGVYQNFPVRMEIGDSVASAMLRTPDLMWCLTHFKGKQYKIQDVQWETVSDDLFCELLDTHTLSVENLQDLPQNKKAILDEKRGHNECSICMEDIYRPMTGDSAELSSAPTILPCGHTFHDTCIMEWLGRSNTCPLCRTTALDEEDYLEY